MMKYLRGLNLLITSIVVLFIIGISGCGPDNFTSPTTDSEYLALDSYEMSKMSEHDFKTVGEAIQRLDISEKNGIYHIKQTSGEQVNISAKLYKLIKEGFEHTNNKLSRSQSFEKEYPVTRLKTYSVEPDDDPDPQTDCVAHAIANMTPNVSYNEALAWLENRYGYDGVPLQAMDQAVMHFYPSVYIASSPATIPEGALNNSLMYFLNSDSTGHAVNAQFYDPISGYIWYKDYQNGGQDGFIMDDNVESVYILP